MPRARRSKGGDDGGSSSSAGGGGGVQMKQKKKKDAAKSKGGGGDDGGSGSSGGGGGAVQTKQSKKQDAAKSKGSGGEGDSSGGGGGGAVQKQSKKQDAANKSKAAAPMVKVLTGGGLTAQRFAGKPLRQPGYSFRDAPKCTRSLLGSAVYEVTRREDFNDSMAEMVLLCNEVMRRQADARSAEARKNKKKIPKRTAKPLSLEYIADRMDVDEPLSGFFVRTVAAAPAPAASVQAPVVPAFVPPPVAAPAPAPAPVAEPSSGAATAGGKDEKQEGRQSRPRRLAAAQQPTPAKAKVVPAPNAQNGAAVATTSSAATSSVAVVSIPASPPPPPPPGWKEGMLQGFITVTTFTNWQKSFRWDSMHDSAFSYDEQELASETISGKRKSDRDGSLAEAMQATVRCGDPWNEGIVWPRIAEISLLGALGCGRALVQLVVERLERTPPAGKRNYDYVVLQATDNSVPFYESMGFVRVGCITDNEDFKEEKEGGEDDEETETEPESDTNGEEKKDCSPKAEQDTSSSTSSKAKPKSVDAPPPEAPPPSEVVSSAVDVITTKQSEKISDIAKRLNVNVWDIIFLNHYVYKHMAPSSKVKKGTELFVPAMERARQEACSNALRNQREHGGKGNAVQWYFSEDDETPKEIAAKFNVECRDLIQGNRDRIPDLQPLSRLHENTRIKVSNFDIHNDTHAPYCHWTFPDDSLETSEPSYMMAMKLDRKSRAAANSRPIEFSLAVPVTKYELSKVGAALSSSEHGSAASSSIQPVATPGKQKKGSRKRKREERHPDEPERPKRPLTAYFFFMSEMRDVLKNEMQTMAQKDLIRVIAQKWKDIPEADKGKYKEMSERARLSYEVARKKYEADMEAFRKANPEWVKEQEERSRIAALSATDDSSCSGTSTAPLLFNKVVKLNDDGRREAGTEFEYFYVLTYLPDLQWCHLAPMRQVGKWGKEKGKAEGRPKWMLVNESEGKEVDISSTFCEIVRSRAIRNNPDADKEQWDIAESGKSSSIDNTSSPGIKSGVLTNGSATSASVEKAARESSETNVSAAKKVPTAKKENGKSSSAGITAGAEPGAAGNDAAISAASTKKIARIASSGAANNGPTAPSASARKRSRTASNDPAIPAASARKRSRTASSGAAKDDPVTPVASARKRSRTASSGAAKDNPVTPAASARKSSRTASSGAAKDDPATPVASARKNSRTASSGAANGGPGTPAASARKSSRTASSGAAKDYPASPAASARKSSRTASSGAANGGPGAPAASAKKPGRGSGKKPASSASKPVKSSAKKAKKDVPKEPKMALVPPRQTRSGRDFN